MGYDWTLLLGPLRLNVRANVDYIDGTLSYLVNFS